MKFHPVLYAFITVLLMACSHTEQGQEENAVPAPRFSYVNIDTSGFQKKQRIYVPLYSSIYLNDKSHTTSLTTTLSIRSTNFTDSIYVTKIDYYDTEGNFVRKLIDKTVLLKPMQTIQLPIDDDVRGIGANVIVEWGAFTPEHPPLIQAVMIGTFYQMGISFVTDGIALQAQ